MTKEEQRIREQIAEKLYYFAGYTEDFAKTFPNKDWGHIKKERWLVRADQILFIEVYKGYTLRDLIEKGVIVADVQSLPTPQLLPISEPSKLITISVPIHWDAFSLQSYLTDITQQDMLKPNSQGMKFVRVSPRDKGGSE